MADDASSLTNGLSEDQWRALQSSLWSLLERQTSLYTQGDSDSLPVEQAQSLLDSILYTLRLYLNDQKLSPTLLITGDLPVIFERAQQHLSDTVELASKRYQLARAVQTPLGNRAYRDTLSGIGAFFVRYDARLAAHEIPCDIDYPLCLPVKEELRGVSYIGEYLARFTLESLFLRRFPIVKARALLSADCLDPEGLLINLYEPIAQSALGLAMLGRDPRPLSIEPDERAALEARLLGRTPPALCQALTGAAAALCQSLPLQSGAEKDYLTAFALTLAPRISAADSLRHIFVTVDRI